jgi:hypothetical protein
MATTNDPASTRANGQVSAAPEWPSLQAADYQAAFTGPRIAAAPPVPNAQEVSGDAGRENTRGPQGQNPPAAVASAAALPLAPPVANQGVPPTPVPTGGSKHDCGNPSILLTPTVLASLRDKASNNTPQWQAFKGQLDSQLNHVIEGGYQGSELTTISDYALGYQILKNSDPDTANRYADKALAIIHSALNDYQKGVWTSRQFLARGDGATTTFTLPNNDFMPSTLKVYLAPVTTKAVVHGASHHSDSVDYYQKFLKASDTPDGAADYTEGVDWQYNADLGNNQIDWSLPGNEPAPGATYYVTEASSIDTALTNGYAVNGTTITFGTAPTPSQAVYVEYLYGTHAADFSTLAYQQTSAGDGGFNSIFIDDSYTSRYLGKHVAMGYDWLCGYPGFAPAVRDQASNLLVRWSDYVRDFGYYRNSPASNYGAGGYDSRMLTALALYGAGDPNGQRLIDEMTAYHQTYVVPVLQNPAPSLQGGFWAEGWNYGALATRNVLTAGLAWEASGLGTADAERQWSSEEIQSLLSEQPTPGTIYDGGDGYAYPLPFPAKNVPYLLSAATTDPIANSYANYMIQHYAGADTKDYEDMLFHDPSANATFWSSYPLAYLAPGTGLVTARADWNYDSTWLSFQLGNLLSADHQTYAPGQLQIQRGGDALLINANAVFENQALQTKSSLSNLIAIDDNGEGLQNYPFNMGVWYGTPGVYLTAYQSDPDFVYTAGDYRAAYSKNTDPGGGGPATELTRQVVYLRPDFIVTHDRVGTVKDYYPKQLRWHFLKAPTVAGNSWVENVGSSTLFGQTFSSLPLSTSSQPVTQGNQTVYRVITNNTDPALKVRYLTALQTAPAATSQMAPSHQVVSADGRMEGVEIANQVVLFGTDGPLNPFTGSVAYTVGGRGPVSHLLTDLEPGRTYQVMADGVLVATPTASDQGIVTFTTTPAGLQTIVVS